jgi:hypothetical protein
MQEDSSEYFVARGISAIEMSPGYYLAKAESAEIAPFNNAACAQAVVPYICLNLARMSSVWLSMT